MSGVYFYVGLVVLSLLSVSSVVTSDYSLASRRSILRAVKNNDRDYAVDLNATNFDADLKDTPATFAVVEFFAHWSPACRNYKRHYEKVARLFNGPDAAHPGIMLMTRIDCALKMNKNLCDKFSVGRFPMLFWGPPSEVVGVSWEPNQEKSDILIIDDGRTADRFLGWINKRMGSSFNLDDQKFENEQHLSSNVSDPRQIARAIYDVEETTSIAFDIILEHKMIKQETHASLLKFLQLLVAHHPSKRCRRGTAELLVSFEQRYPTDFWPADKQEDDMVPLRGSQICGEGVPHGYWMFCRGSKYETRGFSEN
ncbi:hypothetical protein QN277_003810 [Acacia crassicarpa]|uniref:Thioredoxin domain-containing protein n=1 Tax=Acacia crassicarpa TaxID=499986 RepID=A0AAE1J1N3_9FABA|nr:hypothetical protein QN277_003810 [Acacia crassicarpa]